MTEHNVHETHQHTHAEGCGHTALQHEGHTDYLHDGHLHHAHEGHVDEHSYAANTQNPDACSSGHACNAHDSSHRHSEQCGHEKVPHGNHVDYLVEGHLHNAHAEHCDDHGRVVAAAR